MRVILVGMDSFRSKKGEALCKLNCISSAVKDIVKPDGCFSLGRSTGDKSIFLPSELYAEIPKLKGWIVSDIIGQKELELVYEKELGSSYERLVDIIYLEGGEAK